MAAAAAKLLQSCPTLCDLIDGSPPGFPVSGILQARTLEWLTISFSNAWKWKVKVKLLSRVQLLVTPWTAAYQAPLSMGVSRQEYCCGLPLPSLVLTLTTCKEFCLPFSSMLYISNLTFKQCLYSSWLWPIDFWLEQKRKGVMRCGSTSLFCNIFECDILLCLSSHPDKFFNCIELYEVWHSLTLRFFKIIYAFLLVYSPG